MVATKKDVPSINQTIDQDDNTKMEVDCTEICDKKLAECEALVAEGKDKEAIEELLTLEKQTRTSCDMVSTGRVLVAIVKICFDKKDWDKLNEHVVMLSKRRNQLKQAVAKMIQECLAFVDQIEDKQTKITFIETLRTVTEGKIYVEVERARLSHKLAMIKETDGDVDGAANIMQELQIETYGSMDRNEKVELILEQMRLVAAKKDYVRLQIISKKINTRFFEGEKTAENQELKLKYYGLMIELDTHEEKYISVCKHYKAMLNTAKIMENQAEKKKVLQNIVLYLILSTYDNEQADLTENLLKDKLVDEVPVYKKLLQLFTTQELIRWQSLCANYEKELKNGSDLLPATNVFDVNTELGTTHWNNLKNRVVEHNIRIMSKYYSRISIKRMSELLDLSEEDTVEFLSNMVVNKAVSARIDMPAGLVNFMSRESPHDILNTWEVDLDRLMRHINNVVHNIHKEQMIHKTISV